MKKTIQSVSDKIESIRAAHAEGQFETHEVVKSMGDSDQKAASSWGPAMRR